MKIYKIAQQREFELIKEEVPTKIKTEEKSSYEYFDSQLEAIGDVLQEFKRREKGTTQPWSVVPFSRIKKIWEDYMKMGFVRDVKGMESISQRMIQNTHRLYANTYLMGHTASDPTSDFGEYDITEEEQEIFWNYAIDDERGQARISDYGLKPLEELAFKLQRTFKPEDQLQIVDRMFNVVHRRSDLPAFFIEGGSNSLDELFGRPSDNEIKSSSLNWYKKAQEDREYPVAAVVVADGIKFEGRTHGEAIQKGKDAGHIHKDEHGYLIDSSGNDMAFSGAIDLFRTNKGRYINRFQALALGGAVGAEDIPEEDYDIQKDTVAPSFSTAVTPRQIYTKDDVIQNNKNLAPSMSMSMLREKRK